MTTQASHHPSAFVSYAWDDDTHQQWVKEFARRLRGDGVDVTLDQWHSAPGDQLPAFMERGISGNDFVIIICTPQYKQKSESRSGGVGYEGDIITAEVAVKQNHRKFIPVLRLSEWESAAPSWLLGKKYVDLRGDPYPKPRYEDLLVTLHGRREQAPPIGPPPGVAVATSQHARERSSTLIVEGAGTGTWKPLSIRRILHEEVTPPRNDGTQGSELYGIPFLLSRTPSPIWEKAFLQKWDQPSSFTTMHRPGIAQVVGDRIVLDGTTIEEVEKYHRQTLIRAVEAANEIEGQIEQERSSRRKGGLAAENEHRENVKAIAQRIAFPATDGELSLNLRGVWWSRLQYAYPMYLRIEVTYSAQVPDAIKRAVVEMLGQAIDTEDRGKLGPLSAADFKDMVLKFYPPFANGQARETKLVLYTVGGKSAEVRFNVAPSGYQPDELWAGFKPY